MKEIKVWGKYGSMRAEEIDSAPTMKEAQFLLAEYRVAFGQGWSLWIGSFNPANK